MTKRSASLENLFNQSASKMKGIVISGFTGLCLVVGSTSSYAATFSEIGDAGDTFDTAQITSGPAGEALTTINGNLSFHIEEFIEDFGETVVFLLDNDFFRFLYTGTGNLTIESGPYAVSDPLRDPFPAFELFNSSGNRAFFFLGVVCSCGSSQYDYQNLTAGEYVIRIDGRGQSESPQPIYIGDYSIRLIGDTQFLSQSVPEPASTISLSLLGVMMASATLLKRD